MKLLNIFLILFLTFVPFHDVNAEVTLQSLIDQTPSDHVLHLKNGIYNEPIQINKPIILQGNNRTVISSCGKDSTIKINTSKVVLKNITIKYCGKDPKKAAISINNGNEQNFKNLKIDTSGMGIQINKVRNSSFNSVMIKGNKLGNGIDVRDSNSNTFQQIEIQNVMDGIYFETSNQNTVSNSSIKYARYGLHLMYSNDTKLFQNNSHQNFTGIMIMATKNTLVKQNVFSQNNQNVNAQGILLFDAYNTQIIDNQVNQNRVGIYIEKSQQNKITNNKIDMNFIGIVFKNSEKNHIINNSFIGNVNGLQTLYKEVNDIRNNQWDTIQKVDLNHDGINDLPYLADPYFINLTNDVPAYQLFFQSPGMKFIEKLYKNDSNNILMDQQPLFIKSEDHKHLKNNYLLVGLSVVMILTSGLTILWGRK